MTPPKVAIIGAGPAGCMLARLLSQSSIPVTIFEGEASPDYRSQGGTLDLHTSTGLAALKEANLFPEFLAHARYDGDHLQMTDYNLQTYLRVSGPPAPVDKPASTLRPDQRPEIDRADLRRILVEALPSGTIRWDHHVLSFNPSTKELIFKNGAVHVDYDLVVGADGAWSKVRSAIAPDVKPSFSGVGMFELSVPRPGETAKELFDLVGGGNLFAHQEFRRLCVQQMGDGSLGVYALMKVDGEGWVGKLDFDPGDLDAVKRYLLEGERFGGWHRLLRMAVEMAEGRVTARSLWQLPVGFRWDHVEGVTLIGDAAHLMTPFAGEGVNVALEDAMRLARAVMGGDRVGLDGRVREFEKEMWARAERVARLTDRLTKLWMFERGTPGSVIVETSALHVNFDRPAVLLPFTTMFLKGYFFFKGLVGW